jgi:hypothetical protein
MFSIPIFLKITVDDKGLPHVQVIMVPQGPKYFLGAFAGLQKGTISFVMSVHMKHPSSHWTVCHKVLYLSIFFKKSV